jgi:hypothetical protein
MEKNIYSNLGNRINKTFKDKRDSDLFTVKDFIENKWTIQTKYELQTVFIKELKTLLLKENVFELIETFFSLENDMNLAQEKLLLDEDFINFDEFYKSLSPVLMRSILEISKQSLQNEVVLNSIKESIRIAIEELIYQINS